MGWPKGKKRGPVEQGNSAVDEPADEAVEPGDAPADLDGFRAHMERLRLPAVLVELAHPDADERVWDGTYSGFHQKKGPMAAKWNDGIAYPEP